MSDGSNILESLRKIVQDLLVPELRAVRVSVDSMREDLTYMRSDMVAFRTDVRQWHEALRDEMKLRQESLERMIQYGDQRNEQLLLAFIQKFDTAIDMRERLVALEARLPRQ